MDEKTIIMLIVGFLAVAFVIAVIQTLFKKAKRAVRNNPISRAVRQGSDIMSMVKQADINSQLTPKSVSGGDSIFLPQVMKDYPQFNVDLAKSVVENCIRDIFNSLHSGSMTEFKSKYNEKVYSQCEMFLRKYGAISVTGLRVHRTAIAKYAKLYGTSTIKFQTAFQYEKSDKNGHRTMQERFETEYTFKTTDKDGANNAAIRCNYCGAPVERLGIKTCKYCGNEVVLDVEQAWEITDINILN